MSTALDIVGQFNENTHNLLIPIKTVTEIAGIQKPVMNVVHISTVLGDIEIYAQEQEYVLTKKGLNKLARAAGIKIIDTSPVIPSTCQKCVAVNRQLGTAVQCGECNNQDVKFQAKISVPQLTGENIEFVAHKEICIATDTIGMSDKRKQMLLKFRNEICESKALNRAFRAALLVKATYTLAELKKPFVVASLVPNLNDPDVKAAVLQKYSTSMSNMFEEGHKKTKIITISDDELNASDESDSNFFEPDAPKVDAAPIDIPPATQNVLICMNCGASIAEKVSQYSMKKFDRPLCYNCQQLMKKGSVNRSMKKRA